MWVIILIALAMGLLAESCLGRTARARQPVQVQSSFVTVSKALTAASLLGFIALQIYYQGILMSVAGFLQLVGGAYLFQRLVEAGKVSSGVLSMLALVAGPLSLTLLILMMGQFR